MSELELIAQQFEIAGKMKSVHFAIKEDAWLNATEVAKLHKKHLPHYWNSRNTEEYINSLDRFKGTRIDLLKQTVKGKYGGTYIHPDLVLHFARWCSSDFAVQCDMYLKSKMQNEMKQLTLDLVDATEGKVYSGGMVALRTYLKRVGLKKILSEDKAWNVLVDNHYVENAYPTVIKRILVKSGVGKQPKGKAPVFYEEALDEIFYKFKSGLI